MLDDDVLFEKLNKIRRPIKCQFVLIYPEQRVREQFECYAYERRKRPFNLVSTPVRFNAVANTSSHQIGSCIV